MAEWFATMCNSESLCGIGAPPPAPSEQDEEGCYTILEYGSASPSATAQPPPGTPGPRGGGDARGGGKYKADAAHHHHPPLAPLFAVEKGLKPLKPPAAGCTTDALAETDPDGELEAFVVRVRRFS